MELSVARLVIEALKVEGTKHIFGVSGSGVLPVLDIIYNEPQIRYIQSQHEQGAIYMANGYARAAKTVGICLVSPGPGITNCLTGVADAYYTSTPIILIGVEEDTRFHGLGCSLHHDLDTVPVFKPVTKLSLRVERKDRVVEYLQMAFRAALSGRKGPVYFGIPMDVLRGQVQSEVLAPQKYRVQTAPPADPHTISRAVDLLIGAQRPVALAGGGLAWAQAQDLLLELAELLAMPVAATKLNKGIIPEDHPLALGTLSNFSKVPPAIATMQGADVLLAVGCTFGQFTTGSFGYEIVPHAAKIIQVDIEPTEIGKIYAVEVGILGDASSVLYDLLQEIKRRQVDRRPVEGLPRIKELLRMKKEWQESLLPHMTSNKVPIQRLRLLNDLRQALPRDAIVAAFSGSTEMWFEYAFNALAHTCSLGGWGNIGSGYPEALGAKVALPDRVVVCLTGDGGMIMALQEIATAVDCDIPVLCVVCHNGVFGNMRYGQIMHFGGRFIGTDLPIPNLANIATEFGAYGERVEQPNEIIPAVGRALKTGKPALLEIMIDASTENLVPPRVVKGGPEFGRYSQ